MTKQSRRNGPATTVGTWIPAPVGGVLAAGIALALSAGSHTSAATTNPPPAQAHWAFQPVKDPQPPAVNHASWIQTSLDPFILARIEAAGQRPATPADRRTLIRRATFDLTGLPPTPEEIQAFLEDPAPDAFSRVVDRLLQSSHYGEHWGRHWLDVVRYADTAGETADYPVPTAWRYRNYVIDAFNADKPYDQFLREQIAGDILAREGPRERYAEQVAATGYLASSRRFGFDSENYHNLTIQDTIDNLGQTALGLTLGCARCHDHKYDPVSMTDYYALYGIFESSRYPFPGSEQKSKHRSLVPLSPPDEMGSDWSMVDQRLSGLMKKLQANGQPTTPAVLRSLGDMDGDFEMQAPAAGGSRGVLVPPWVYDGMIAVTREAQSPFNNLHPLGSVGASLPGGTNAYQFGQSIHPAYTHETGGKAHLNLDFRVGAASPSPSGSHRFWAGTRTGGTNPAPAFEIVIQGEALQFRSGSNAVATLARLDAGKWHNLRLTLDLGARTVSGDLTVANGTVPVASQPLIATWNGVLDFVGMGTDPAGKGPPPPLDIDNLAVSRNLIPSPAEAALASSGKDRMAGLPRLNEELTALTGIDGDFELQLDAKAPGQPWGPGPNSAVKISVTAQSSFTHIYPAGKLGIRLPASTVYNGFGQTLSNTWKAPRTERLHVAFDVRPGKEESAPGSWRYYLGHGAGPSPAVELFFNDSQCFVRDGEKHLAIAPIRRGEWHHVRYTLDLKARTFVGSITSSAGSTEFHGTAPAVWDGAIDYTFIDSYGHLAGARTTLDADNFAVAETPLPGPDAPSAGVALDAQRRRDRVAALREEVGGLQSELDRARQELNAILSDDSLNLAYAMAEGTPRNTRIQLRGDQDRLGAEVPRGFLRVLGGDILPGDARGSGRRELAQWITRRENPLTARVMVNRIWQYHFGRGLVRTANDFGLRGEAPSHPDLLDHLASRFMASGWSIKAMHRLILNSATYQQQSTSSGGDTDKPLYAGFRRHRLEAEAVRDSILFASGELELKPARGHPFPNPTSWGFSQHAPFSAAYDHNQRSVYLMTQRIKRHPFLALFDGADPNGSTPVRSVSTVPTQALYFMNDPFVHEKAARFASRLVAGGGTEADRISQAYTTTLGRRPSDAEQKEALEFLAAYRSAAGTANGDSAAEKSSMAALVRALFSSNEFIHVD